jgi:hypothetical protein
VKNKMKLQELFEAKKKKLEKDSDDPCWDGYVQVGTKKKDGKEVPNCVPIEEAVNMAVNMEGVDLITEGGQCDGPTKKASSTRKDKKWMQCVKQSDGSYKRVHWGDPNAKVTGKSGDTKRKKSFRARHNCDSAKKGSAQAQACKDW